MNILDIIAKKRDGKELEKEELEYFVNGYSDGSIKDYQAAALVMAIFIQGMTSKETTDLTLAMANSGEVLDLSSLNQIIVDKHSTGGVGDKVSLILLPLVSACGVPVAKMSGKGLGFTGGTIDKLQSIPGYKTDIDINNFVKNVENIGISIISQTLNLAPADKKLYALRDTISSVESIPLIASSIMSKKIASGADKIVLDVTVGKGAFMQTMDDAKTLAKEMIEIGKLAKRETICVLTNMDEPLGYAVGNTLEVKEAVEALRGNMPEDVKEVVFELGAYMLMLAKKASNVTSAKEILEEKLNSKAAYNKLIELVKNQGGDISYITDLERLEKAKCIEPVYSSKCGYIQSIDAKEVGRLACRLGAGRIRKEDEIDSTAGIILNKKVGDYVEKGECLAYIHTNLESMVGEAVKELLEIVEIEEEKCKPAKLILGVL